MCACCSCYSPCVAGFERGVPLCCPVCPCNRVYNNCCYGRAAGSRNLNYGDFGEYKWYQRMTNEQVKQFGPHSKCNCLLIIKDKHLWYDHNRPLFEALAKLLHRSKEFAQFVLMKITHLKIGKLLGIQKQQKICQKVPFAEMYDPNDKTHLFDDNGKLSDPTHPDSLRQALEIIQLFRKTHCRAKTADNEANQLLLELFMELDEKFPLDHHEFLVAVDELEFEKIFKTDENLVYPAEPLKAPLRKDIVSLYLEVAGTDDPAKSLKLSPYFATKYEPIQRKLRYRDQAVFIHEDFRHDRIRTRPSSNAASVPTSRPSQKPRKRV